MVTVGRKAIVSERALIQRINRKLDGRVLKVTRGARMMQSVGYHYILDVSVGGVVDTHVDVEDLGRELDCLANWEEMEKAE